MRHTLIHLVLSASAIMAPATVRAADDLKPLTEPQLPMPSPIPNAIQPAAPVTFYRPNRLDVWQNLAVDRSGRWVPRVALTGNGAYYMYNGWPYYFMSVKPNVVMPYLLD